MFYSSVESIWSHASLFIQNKEIYSKKFFLEENFLQRERKNAKIIIQRIITNKIVQLLFLKFNMTITCLYIEILAETNIKD